MRLPRGHAEARIKDEQKLISFLAFVCTSVNLVKRSRYCQVLVAIVTQKAAKNRVLDKVSVLLSGEL